MNHKGHRAPWDRLSIKEFRAFADRITEREAALAICADICADAQSLADDLLYGEETDALRHPKDKFWRRKALGAQKYLERKREIIVGRVLALGGTAPDDVVREIKAAAKREKAERRIDPGSVLCRLRAIIADLAECDVLAEGGDGGLECFLCDKPINGIDGLRDHAEECPWRRAAEEIEQFPVRDFDPDIERAREERRGRAENHELGILRQQYASLEKKLAAKAAHAARMEEGRKMSNGALRAAVRRLMRTGDEEGLREIGEVDAGYLTPEFYDLKPRGKEMK